MTPVSLLVGVLLALAVVGLLPSSDTACTEVLSSLESPEDAGSDADEEAGLDDDGALSTGVMLAVGEFGTFEGFVDDEDTGIAVGCAEVGCRLVLVIGMGGGLALDVVVGSW